jgi:hypothetical protein
MPPLLHWSAFAVEPGRGPEFGASIREDVLPAYKKAGVRDFWVYGPNFGNVGAGYRALVSPLAKYADFDATGLLQRAGLSPDQIAKMNARRDAVAVGTENVVYRFIPELSYGMPPVPPGTN